MQSNSESDVDTNLDSSDMQTKKHHGKSEHASESDSSSSKSSVNDDFLNDLNDTPRKTSRDLKLKKPYKLLKLKVTNEIGFNGSKYKKAVAKLQDPKTKKISSIIMPRSIANYNSKTLKEMNKRIQKKKYPIYTVKKISTKKRPDQKGHYDLVDFKWS